MSRFNLRKSPLRFDLTKRPRRFELRKWVLRQTRPTI